MYRILILCKKKKAFREREPGMLHFMLSIAEII